MGYIWDDPVTIWNSIWQKCGKDQENERKCHVGKGSKFPP
jgi:hypothetical protein